MAICMELARVLIRETDNTHVVELREADGDRIFPILIGGNEAAAIERRLMGHHPPRPQTHELLANVITQMGGSIDRVMINDLKDQTFYARLIIRVGEELIDIDCRPSDAIALALRVKAPIYVNETVIEAAKSLDLPDTSKHNTEEKDQWRKWIDNIKPQDFGNL